MVSRVKELESDLERVKEDGEKKDKAIVELAQVLDLQMGGNLTNILNQQEEEDDEDTFPYQAIEDSEEEEYSEEEDSVKR